jgi:hypothetical protein
MIQAPGAYRVIFVSFGSKIFKTARANVIKNTTVIYLWIKYT